MSPSTRSETRKNILAARSESSCSSKRKLDNDFAATIVSPVMKGKKVPKMTLKNPLKVSLGKTQKRKRQDKAVSTPKNTKKAKGTEVVEDSDSDFEENTRPTPKITRSGIKIGICKGKFKRVQKVQTSEKKTLQFRCTLPVYDKEKLKEYYPITPGVKEILSQTPFATLFEALVEGKVKAIKSNNQLGMILKTYSHEDDAFVFGIKKFRITLSDISEILGLNIEGDYIIKDETPLSGYFYKIFGNVVEIKRSDVSDAIKNELVNEPETESQVRYRDENLSRLLLLDIFIKFQFPNGKGTLHIKIVRTVENLNDLHNYAWAKEVAICLRKKLFCFKTRDCSSKNTGGCAYIILYWLCMRTNIIRPIAGMEDEPHLIRRWDLKELKKILQKMTLREIFVKFRSENMDEEEIETGQSDVIDKLIQDVKEAKCEILLLKENAQAQDIKIEKLEKYIDEYVHKRTFNSDGSGKGVPEGFGKENKNEEKFSEMGMGAKDNANDGMNDVSVKGNSQICVYQKEGATAKALTSDFTQRSASSVSGSSGNKKFFKTVDRSNPILKGASSASKTVTDACFNSPTNVGCSRDGRKLVNGSREQWAVILGGDNGNMGSGDTVERSTAFSFGMTEEEMDLLGEQALIEFELSSAKKNEPEVEYRSSEVTHADRAVPNQIQNDPLKQLCDIDPPTFNLLSDDEMQTPIQTVVPVDCAFNVIHIDELEAGSTGKSIGVYSYTRLPEKRERKPKQEKIYYYPEVRKLRLSRNKNTKDGISQIIDVENLEDPKEAKVLKRVKARRAKIADMLDAETKKRLADFKEYNPDGNTFWNGTGKWITDITTHEIDVLLSDEAIKNVIIDAFSNLLSRELSESTEILAPKVEFLFTQAWLAAEKLDIKGMHEYIFEPLYEYIGSAQIILIPLFHKVGSHFTLLIFFTNKGQFRHMDSQPGVRIGTGQSFKDAQKMVTMINFWMRAVEFQSEWMMEHGVRDKFDVQRSTPSDLVMKIDRPLTLEEIETIKWVQNNYVQDFELVREKHPYPKQPSTSVECGVYVMHYMQCHATEEDPNIPPFRQADATKFRVNLVKRFAARQDSWRVLT